MKKPRLFIIIPCYNEQEVLPITAPLFLKKLNDLIAKDKIHSNSKILFIMMVRMITHGILFVSLQTRIRTMQALRKVGIVVIKMQCLQD